MAAKLERIDKIIASQQKYSRRDVKDLVKKGLITVNGKVVSDSGEKYDSETADIAVAGESIKIKKNIYILLNKPEGYVSATTDKNDKTVLDLVPAELYREGLFPAGRLDKDTVGMMIITDDGDFAHKILSPKNHIDKSYIATIDIPVTEKMKETFDSGIELKGEKKCMPAHLDILSEYTARVTIHEGMYHQIKRMFGCCGAKVLSLKRVSMGGLLMDESLESGQCRELTESELLLLRRRSL